MSQFFRTAHSTSDTRLHLVKLLFAVQVAVTVVVQTSCLHHRSLARIHPEQIGPRNMTGAEAVKPLIAPSILACDFTKLGDESQRMLDAGADWLHLDVMDGHFVPSISLGAPVVKSLRGLLPKGRAYFDVHLMVSDPETWIAPFQAAGADQFTFHLEAAGSPENAVLLAKKIKLAGMDPGISIKPGTPFECVAAALDSGLFHTFLVMTVEPGFGGQSFMPDMMSKVQQARQKYANLNIQVDGGLNSETTKISAENGANVIVAGTSLFKCADPVQLIEDMRMSVRGAGASN